MDIEIKVWLYDILNAINEIESFLSDSPKEFAAYQNDLKTRRAVERNIEIIGEASKNIPTEIQQSFSDIPWQKLRGIRNRIVHDYFDVDRKIIWFIVTSELTTLKKSLQNHIQA